MGVLEFFGTLIKNDITSTSIRINFTERLLINHLFLDFNSIIHVASQKIISDVNSFLELVLRNLYQNRSVSAQAFTEKFERYQMQKIQAKITQNSSPDNVVTMFKNHFTEKYMDKLIITLVINTVLHIIRTYCHNKHIQTLLLAIDGVPSKGKLIEQKQRRYFGAIIEDYKKKILSKYKNYLLEQPDNVYTAIHGAIKWNRWKITPGTAFMHKLVTYLKSEQIQLKMKVNRPNMEIIVSDMYEVGEGEKKIVNYINKFLPNTNESVMVYSPDADVILLCMLLPVKKLYMLRHNQQASPLAGTNIYDLIDIRMLKSNISYYINNSPDYAKENFDIDRINYDIVCISSLFGNDFVPKIETLDVKKGFQNIMDAYLRSLIKLKDKGYYLVKTKNDNGHFGLNFTFLKCIMNELLKEENDYIKHNKLYNKYITVGQMKNVFDYMEINSENIVSVYNEFRQEYENLKNLIKNNGNYGYYETNDRFMNSLKKSAIISMDNQSVTTSYLTNKEMIRLVKDYYRKNRDFPRLNINLNEWSHSINDYRHKKILKEKKLNDYKKEVYKFDNLLDEYYVKFNHQPLDLSKNKIPDYYKEYFHTNLYDETGNLSEDAAQVMYSYMEGLVWVFNYYFNDTSYVNRWYYKYERAPLMRHFYAYLTSIDLDFFKKTYKNLKNYNVDDLATFFNPVEQLVYVVPMTEEGLKLLPMNYQKYITSDKLDPFLRDYFLDIHKETDKLWREKIAHDVDCRGIPFLQKCLVKPLTKNTTNEDMQFLKSIRKVIPNAVSLRRSRCVEPDY